MADNIRIGLSTIVSTTKEICLSASSVGVENDKFINMVGWISGLVRCRSFGSIDRGLQKGFLSLVSDSKPDLQNVNKQNFWGSTFFAMMMDDSKDSKYILRRTQTHCHTHTHTPPTTLTAA